MVRQSKKLSDEEVEAVVRAVCRSVGNRKKRSARQLLAKRRYPVTLAIAGTVFRRQVTLLAKGDVVVGPPGRTSSTPGAEDLLAVIFAGLGPKTRQRIANYVKDRFARAAAASVELDEIILHLADHRITARHLLSSLSREKTRAGEVKFEGKEERSKRRR